jgi:hypothetical protein
MSKSNFIIKRSPEGVEYIWVPSSNTHKEIRPNNPELHDRSKIRIKRYGHGRGHLSARKGNIHLDHRFSYVGPL